MGKSTIPAEEAKAAEQMVAYAREIRRLEARCTKAQTAVGDAKEVLKDAKDELAIADGALHQYIRDDTPPLFE